MRNMDILNEKLSNFDVNTVGKYTVMGTVKEEVWIKFNVLHAQSQESNGTPIIEFKRKL